MSTRVRRLGTASVALSLLLSVRGAFAGNEPSERAVSREEVTSWLDSDDAAPTRLDRSADDDSPVPPPPPRHHGFVLESGLGAFGQIGDMKHVSPLAPWFHVQFGYEPLRFLMVFAEGDLVLANTSYAHPPPPPRTYALWGVGAGLRGTVRASERISVYAQASLGGARVTDDVLSVYGYEHADRVNLYFAGELGLEWYQVSAHLALALHGGLRDYTATFERQSSTGSPLCWVSGLALRYAF